MCGPPPSLCELTRPKEALNATSPTRLTLSALPAQSLLEMVSVGAASMEELQQRLEAELAALEVSALFICKHGSRAVISRWGVSHIAAAEACAFWSTEHTQIKLPPRFTLFAGRLCARENVENGKLVGRVHIFKSLALSHSSHCSHRTPLCTRF